MITFKSLVNEVLDHTQGCNDLLAERILRQTAQSFFRATNAFRVDTVINGIDGQAQYPVTLGSEAYPVEIIYLKEDGEPLGHTSDGELMQYDIGTAQSATKFMFEDATVTLYPTPEHVGELQLRVAAIPTNDAEGIPDDLGYLYRDAIVYGAISRLLMQSGMEWYNPSLGRQFQQMHSQAVFDAKNRANKSYTPVRKKVAYGGL